MWELAQPLEQARESDESHEICGQHAFVMAGGEDLFLCHMPMVDIPCHMYQLVLRVSLPHDDMETYRNALDKQDETGVLYLANSERDRMAIVELANGSRTSFAAMVWDHAYVHPGDKAKPWETPGEVLITPLIDETTVTVEQVVYFRTIDLNLNRPETLTYVLFGRGSEAHLHHYMVKEPEFDQVVTLREAPAWLSEPELEAGIHVNFPHLPTDRHQPVRTNPLQTGTPLAVRRNGIGPSATDGPGRLTVTVGRNLWFNTSIANPQGHDPNAPTVPHGDA